MFGAWWCMGRMTCGRGGRGFVLGTGYVRDRRVGGKWEWIFGEGEKYQYFITSSSL